MISSKYTIREQNEATILKEIILAKEISRAQLSVSTGLNKASVSAITKKLLDDQLIKETRTGEASTQGGRKPIFVQFDGHSALAIGIDLGPDYVEAMLTYIDGTVIDTYTEKKTYITADSILTKIVDITNQFLAHKVPAIHGIIGLCLAIHGRVSEQQILFTPYYNLDESHLQTQFAELFDFPVYIENEANLSALGEYTFGSTSKNLVSLSIHTGVGAGIVENGLLLQGAHGKAGEIGHSILFPDGRPCPCGNHGCLEQYTSLKVLLSEFAKLKKVTQPQIHMVAEQYQRQDTETRQLIETHAKYLSIGLNNLAAIYDPEILIINSSIYRAIPQLLAMTRTHLLSHFSNDMDIQLSKLGEQATLLGAIAKSTQEFLNIKNLKLTEMNANVPEN